MFEPSRSYTLNIGRMKNCEFNFVYSCCVTNIRLGNNSDGQNMLTHLVTRLKKC